MNLGKRISLIYSAITIFIVVLVGFAFWISSGNYCDYIYYRHLEEKAEFVAMERFERDEMDSASYQKLIERRTNAISTDRCVFINMNDTDAYDQLTLYLNEAQISSLMSDRSVRISRDIGTAQIDDDEMGAGILYADNEGTFVVLIFSHNPYLNELSQFIGWGLLAVVIITSLLLYLISRLYAMRTVNNIADAYQAERLFIDNASHEISNPLTAIKGECEIALMRQRSEDDYRRTLGKISQETDRIITIMRELIQLSHAEKECASNKTQIAISLLLSGFKTDKVCLDIMDDFTVNVNETLLHIALRNIISNAVKYGNGNIVTITVNRSEVNISDNGIGIPKGEISHIFNPFFRASNTTSHRGHGIGLALAYRILKASGFSVKVKSTPERGTCFTLKYP